MISQPGRFWPLTPQSRTQDLRVEALLVLPDLGRVAVRADVGGVHVDHRDLAGLVEPGLLLLLLQELVGEQRCGTAVRNKDRVLFPVSESDFIINEQQTDLQPCSYRPRPSETSRKLSDPRTE